MSSAAERRLRSRQALPHPGLRILATAGGVGTLIPKGAGTLASLVALLPAIALPAGAAGVGFAALSLVASLASVIAARALKDHADPGWFVLDEFAGQWLTLALLAPSDWITIVLAFIAFRAFDIWKPFPIRILERVPGGFGIVLDDLLAGVYAAGVVVVLRSLTAL